MSSVLDRIDDPRDVKSLTAAQLVELASDLRAEMIAATALNGGHLASSLGAVEIVLAAYRVLDLPRDKLLFDVGHQSYAHKLLTGRRAGFAHLRHTGGVSGFTRRGESPYDVHDAGHASDALATAAGIASVRDIQGGDERIVSVVGDASLAGGLSYEALNFIGQHQFRRFVVVLNDNEMSISPSVGALASYLAAIRTNPCYTAVRDQVEESVSSAGRVGDAIVRLGERAKQATKQFLVPGMLFEELGFTYLGPIDGHDVRALQETLDRALDMGKPVIIHAVTRKGKGYAPAERNPELFHGVSPFDPATGEVHKKQGCAPSYSSVFSQALIREARDDRRIVAITAAMMEGTSLASYARAYPDRVFDVGIAEECAVTLASGMALAGAVPVVTIYSTFLQRAFDEISTNVCLPRLHVVFAIDRGGLVGEDGSTHHGMFDLAYLRCLPNMRICAPSSSVELARALRAALLADGPVAVRYPRGSAPGGPVPDAVEPLPPTARVAFEAGCGPEAADGRGEAPDVSVLAVGRMVGVAVDAAAEVCRSGASCRVYDMRWVKPVDADAVRAAAASRLVVTMEDGTVSGGFGSGVLESMADQGLVARVLRLGLPDSYVGHGSTPDLLRDLGLDVDGVARSVLEGLANLSR